MAAFVHDISRETHGLKKLDKFPQPTASHRSEIRTSGWVHDKVSACASDLLLECSLRTRHVVSPTRDCGKSARGQGRSVPDNFLRRLREMVNVPHHCLATVSVAVHTGHLGLRIQGLPLPGHHPKLTRHVSYVCVGVVDGIQLRIPQCEEDNLDALGEFIHICCEICSRNDVAVELLS